MSIAPAVLPRLEGGCDETDPETEADESPCLLCSGDPGCAGADAAGVSERNVDPEGLSWVSDTADAVTADGERVLLFRCQSPKGAEDQENSLWEVMNEQAKQVTSFVLGDCLVVYAGEDPALKAALDRIA